MADEAPRHELLGYSAAQVRAAEQPLIEAGVPLMQRAAAGLAAELRSLLEGRSGVGSRVLLLVGSGDNGADTLYAGAALAADGGDVAMVAVGSRVHEAAAAAARAAGARQVEVAEVADEAARADVVVDGILGTGSVASPALRGTARQVVAAILPVLRAPARPIVVAVDLPSGIHPDDGTVPDPVVLPADVTVTFGALKAGLLRSPARESAGDVRLVDIGLGPALVGVQPVVRVPVDPAAGDVMSFG